jgi:hypothetical protein
MFDRCRTIDSEMQIRSVRMDRPLWQIFLALFLVSFVVQRGAAAYAIHLTGTEPELMAGHAVQAALGLVTAVGIWLGSRWVLGALIALGVSVAATALVAGFQLGVRPVFAAVAEAMVALVAAGGLAALLRTQLES